MNRGQQRQQGRQDQQGFALITALLMVVVLGAMATAYFFLTQIEVATTASSAKSTTGFYAAEAGLNLRGNLIEEKFKGYNHPAGSSPGKSAPNPCAVATQDFKCISYQLDGRTVNTYAVEENNGQATTIDSIPDGKYAGLSAQEYRYQVVSEAVNTQGDTEAQLRMVFRSRLVPMFQFAAFFQDDLEVGPGPEMNLSGRLHSNQNIYFAPQDKLKIDGNVTSGKKIYNGRANGDREQKDSSCVGQINIKKADGNNYKNLDKAPSSCSPLDFTDAELAEWGGTVQQGVGSITIPDPGVLDPDTSSDPEKGTYWKKADLRVVLKLGADGKEKGIEIQDAEGNKNTVQTALFEGCNGVLGDKAKGNVLDTSDTFYNNREKKNIKMLEVDMGGLLECFNKGASKGLPSLSDSSDGGLVFHFSVDGPQKGGVNNYGVRIRNGKELAVKDAPPIKGLTVVTNQALYVQGDYNSENKKPASFLSDSINVLSNSWCDVEDGEGNCSSKVTSKEEVEKSQKKCEDAKKKNKKDKDCLRDANSKGTYGRVVDDRKASDSEINAAMLAGVDKTGAPGKEGNGGLHNFPRMHEYWKGKTLKIRGSFVSLGEPKHVNGKWSTGDQYAPPNRNWDYDTDFNDAGKLPPLSPRFVYLVQELFLRDFGDSSN